MTALAVIVVTVVLYALMAGVVGGVALRVCRVRKHSDPVVDAVSLGLLWPLTVALIGPVVGALALARYIGDRPTRTDRYMIAQQRIAELERELGLPREDM